MLIIYTLSTTLNKGFIMFNIDKKFTLESVSNFIDWIFKKELQRFDNLSYELKKQHDSPIYNEIISKSSRHKKYSPENKISIPVDLFLNDSSEIEPSGLSNDYAQ